MVYTICIKDKWLSTLQKYYNWIYTKFGLKIAKICTDYKTKLYSKKATMWMDDLSIKFELAALHAQEENGIVECLQQTSTEITHLMIFASNIPDFLWFNIFFVAMHIKNKSFIKAFDGILFYKKFKGKPLLIYHLWALKSIIYFFIAKEDCIKLVKFVL